MESLKARATSNELLEIHKIQWRFSELVEMRASLNSPIRIAPPSLRQLSVLFSLFISETYSEAEPSVTADILSSLKARVIGRIEALVTLTGTSMLPDLEVRVMDLHLLPHVLTCQEVSL
jgi:hypothetical protein